MNQEYPGARRGHYRNNNRPVRGGHQNRNQGQQMGAFNVITNFLRLNVPEDGQIRRLKVTVVRRNNNANNQGHSSSEWRDVTDTDPKERNREVVEMFCATDISGCCVYDGRSEAYCSENFPVEKVQGSHEITDGNGRPITKVTFMPQEGPSSIGKDTMDYCKALNLVFDCVARKKYIKVGKCFYNRDNYLRIDTCTEAWHGYYQSTRHCAKGFVLNIDKKLKTFWGLNITKLIDLLQSLASDTPLGTQHDEWWDAISEDVAKIKVRTTHTQRQYRVHGFSKSANEESVKLNEGEEKSISQYFLDRYNIVLNHPELPCVRLHPTEKRLIPLELLDIVENQSRDSELSQLGTEKQKAVHAAACIAPHERLRLIKGGLSTLELSSGKECSDFRVAVESRLMSVRAKMLGLPQIYFSGVKPSDPYNGSWKRDRVDTLRKGVAQQGRWAIVDSAFSERERKSVIIGLKNAARYAGLHFMSAGPSILTCRCQSDTISKTLANARLQNPLIIVVILRGNKNQNGNIYAMIKRDNDLGQKCITQVCASGSMNMDKLSGYCNNVILKINSKLGGINFAARTKSPARLPFEMNDYIVLGADVSHPMINRSGMSVAALVGSKDKDALQYSGVLHLQEGGKEIISSLGDMFKNICGKWHGSQSHRAPKSIIFFRDGVSEGQYEQAKLVELEALRKACFDLFKTRPNITYIVVTKRHHARFFNGDRGNSHNFDRKGNLKPGAVIDSEITRGDDLYEFYLNSHSGNIGTNKPSRYTVLCDENMIGREELQNYVFRLCHEFMRCTRSVSIVNSVYYAHLLAFRGRTYLKGLSPRQIESFARNGFTLPENLFFL